MSTTKYPKFRWYVMLTMLFATIANSMVLIAPSPLVGEIATSLGIELGAVTGALMVPFALIAGFSAIAGGWLVDKIGVVRTYIICSLLFIIPGLLTPVIGHSLGILILIRLVQGLAAGPTMTATSKIAAEWFPISERPIVTGIQAAGFSIGIAFGAVVAPLFAVSVGWEGAFAFITVGAMVTLILTIIMAFGPKPPINSETQAINKELHAKDFALALKQPVFWIGFIAVFANSFLNQGYNDLTPGHMAVDAPVGLGLGPVVAGRIMGIFQIAFMVGALTSGFITIKIFAGKAKSVLVLSSILTGVFAIGVIVSFISGNTTLLTIDLIICGFFMGMPNAVTIGFIATNYPEHINGRVGGMTLGLGMFGGTLGLIICSALLHITGFYTVSVIVCSIITIVAGLIALGLNPPKVFARTSDCKSPETL